MEDESSQSEDESSQSDDESDDESQAPSVTTTPDDNESCSDASGREAAESLLGVSLEALMIMRLEAQRARDVVDGRKTLELTKGRCRKRGLVLVCEKAKGATAKGCASLAP